MDAAIRSPRVGLRPVVGSDYEYVFALETTGDRLETYRHRGVPPTPETFSSRLWNGVTCQFIVERVADGKPLGLVACYGAEMRDRFAHVALVADDLPPGLAALFIEGFEMFVDYLFGTFGFRKLYGEVLEVNLPKFQSVAGRFFAIEGRLKGHALFRGRWIDEYVLAVHAEVWHNRHRAEHRAKKLAPIEPDSSFGDFTQALRAMFDLGPQSMEAASRLVDDLGLDSILLLELVDFIEEQAGEPLPDEAIESLVTVGDAHHFYAARKDRGRAPAHA